MKKAPILTVAVFVAIAAIWLSFTAAGAQTASTDSPAKGDAPSVSDGSPTAGNRDGKTEADSDERPLAITAPELLQRARYRIHGYRSVKANLIETVVIGDRKFRANGTYLQGRDLQLKMSLKLRLGKDGEFRASMLQVCDGQVLWTSHTSGREVDKPDTVDGSEKKSGI